MFSLTAGAGVGGDGGDLPFRREEEEDLLDSGDGDGVVSREDDGDVEERDLLKPPEAAAVSLCLT